MSPRYTGMFRHMIYINYILCLCANVFQSLRRKKNAFWTYQRRRLLLLHKKMEWKKNTASYLLERQKEKKLALYSLLRSIEILEKLKWIPIDESLRNSETIMTFKALTKRLPNYLTDLFTKCENDNYNLRSNNTKLSQLKPKTNFLKRSFSYRAAKAWNELPNEITDNFENLSILSLKWRLKSAQS